jgi:hypothetical protein
MFVCRKRANLRLIEKSGGKERLLELNDYNT